MLAHLPTSLRAPVVHRNMLELAPERRAEVERALDDELDGVRRDGFALDDQTYTPGVYCVAAPYFSADGTVGGSVAVSVPAVRFPKRRKLIISAVLEAARSCSELMGYHGATGRADSDPTAS